MVKLLRKKREKESWLKYLMSVSHLWLGLLSAILVFFVCLSGSMYAFQTQIENFVNREALYVRVESVPPIALDSLLTTFENQYGKATRITQFEKNDKAVLISSFSKQNSGVTAYFNPYSGKETGVENENAAAFFEFILEFHRFLLAGDVGKFINGSAVLIFVYMLISGFVLWLPKKIKQLKNGFLIKWNARFYRLNYDLHKVLGFYSMLLLFFIALTGLYVSFHWVKNGVIVSLGGDSIVISEDNTALKKSLANSFDELFQNLNTTQSAEEIGQLSLQEVLITTDSLLNYTGVTTLFLPDEQNKSCKVERMNNHNYLGFTVPDGLIFSKEGKLTQTALFYTLPLHEQFKAIAKPLHTGEIMGLTSVVIYFLISLIGCSLPITGIVIWWRRG